MKNEVCSIKPWQASPWSRNRRCWIEVWSLVPNQAFAQSPAGTRAGANFISLQKKPKKQQQQQTFQFLQRLFRWIPGWGLSTPRQGSFLKKGLIRTFRAELFASLSSQPGWSALCSCYQTASFLLLKLAWETLFLMSNCTMCFPSHRKKPCSSHSRQLTSLDLHFLDIQVSSSLFLVFSSRHCFQFSFFSSSLHPQWGSDSNFWINLVKAKCSETDTPNFPSLLQINNYFLGQTPNFQTEREKSATCRRACFPSCSRALPGR